MHSYKVYKNTWHYELVYSAYRFDDMPKDFCSYWRAVVGCILAKTMLYGTMIVVVIVLILGLGAAIYYEPIQMLSLAMTVLISVGLGLLYTYFISLFKTKSQADSKQPSLLAAKYDSWKNRYCPSIEYENDNR